MKINKFKFCGIFLCSVVATSAFPAAQGKKSYATFVAAAKSVLVRDFKDPNSAQFRDTYVSAMSDAAIALCGEVNAKNSYGAYIGFKKFLVIQINGEPISQGKIASDEVDVVFDTLFKGYCSDKLRDVP